MTSAILYRISSPQPASHIFQVVLTIANPHPEGQQLRLPNWIPGSYMIRDFSRHVGTISAQNDKGVTVAAHKTGKSDWQCEKTDGALIIHYEVYAWDLSVRGAHLDQTHAFFNGTSVFLEVVGQQERVHTVEMLQPENQKDWRVATSLPLAASTKPFGFGLYQAANYDELIDHPVEWGDFTVASFTACGVLHEVVITGLHRADMSRLCRDLEKICTTQIQFFGEPAPFSRYVFLVTAVGTGYGGLEHRASTALLCSRDDLPLSTEPEEPASRYRGFLGLCSHEYFHSWNVKRIKPAVFQPYDLRQETYTPLLWAFEGITSYYDDLMLLRAGVISTESYLELLSQQVTRHLRTVGRFHQSVADSSWDVWTKYYKQEENAVNSIVSYYVKGSLIALCLDLLMRQHTEGRISLDTLMQTLWQQFGKVAKGVGDEDIPRVAAELCGSAISKAQWQTFWQNALYQTDELPFGELLVTAGVSCTLRAADNAQDLGGKPSALQQVPAWWGARTQAAEGGVALQSVVRNSPAQQAGLSAHDLVVAINGLRINQASIEKTIASYAAGDVLTVHAFRRDELMAFSVTLANPPQDTCVLALNPEAADGERAMQWLLGH